MNYIHIANIRPEPQITTDAIAHLRKAMESLKNPKVLEFGSGYSTAWFSNGFDCELTSVEHDVDWYNKTFEMVNNKNTTLILKRSELISPGGDCLVDSYASECDKFEDEHFDIILIDGRNRVDCFNHSERTLKRGGTMILDNSERPEYSHVLEVYKDKTTYFYPQKEGGRYYDNGTHFVWTTQMWTK